LQSAIEEFVWVPDYASKPNAAAQSASASEPAACI
jgi:hypothetical protein